MNEQGIKIAVKIFKEASKILHDKMFEGIQTILNQKNITELVGKEVPIQGNGHSLSVSQFIPSTVLNAFSIELNLKLLIYQKTGVRTKSIHELDELFKKLDDSTKEVILADVCAELNIDNVKFNDNLKECAKTFIDWRYFYENHQNVNISFLNSFGVSIMKYTEF